MSARVFMLGGWVLVAALTWGLRKAPALPGAPVPRDQILPYLLGIELVPNRALLDSAAGDATESALLAIAGDPSALPTARLHGLVALGHYASPETHALLAATITNFAAQKAGVGTLYLRAATSSLCRVAGDGAVDQVSQLLAHPVKDVRAEAAEALSLTRSSRALRILRGSLLTEKDALVRLALVDAIRILSPLPTGP